MLRLLIKIVGAASLILVTFTVLSLVARNVGERAGLKDTANDYEVVAAFICGSLTAFLYGREEKKGEPRKGP